MADRAVILLALQLAGRAVAASPAALKLPMQPLLTGASIPALGFGTYTLDGDELKQALLHAIECGYRHIDTAAGYGNEAVVAEAIAESEVPREDFFYHQQTLVHRSWRRRHLWRDPLFARATQH